MSEEENSKEEKAPGDAEARLIIKDLDIDPKAFSADLEYLRRRAPSARELVRTVNKIAGSVELEDFREWYSDFAKSLENLNEPTRQWIEIQRRLQQVGLQQVDRFGPVYEALSDSQAAMHQWSAAVADLVSSTRLKVNIELPPPDVVDAALTEALLNALEKEPPEDEPAEVDEWFAATILAQTWSELEERGITLDGKQVILLIVAQCLFHLMKPAFKPALDTLYPPAPLRSAVVSESKLRVEAGDTAKVEALLKPGQDVEHLEEKEGWALVRFFDEEDEEYRIGWVKGEDLTTIEEKR